MTYFYLAAAAIIVVALTVLLRPWWRSGHRYPPAQRNSGYAEHASAVPPGDTASHNSLPALNAAIHRDRLTELERDHSNGTLTAVNMAEAREELQRQLLDDTAATEVHAASGASWKSGLVLGVLVSVVAVALYAMLGSPAAVLPVPAQAQRATADMEQLTARLAQKMEQNPNNPEGWVMLARAYKSMGRWDDAERAYGRIGPDFDKNAELLAELAELLVQKNNGFTPRSRELIQQALRIEPANMLALFLGGGEAFDGERYAEAVAFWQRLLPNLEPGGEDAQMVEASIARARELGGGRPAAALGDARPGTAAPKDEAHRGVGKEAAAKGAEPKPAAAKAGAEAVSGRVELAAALKDKAKPDDVVFIFARAVDGPRMPLAAKRARVADLPLDFTLDDSQAVMPGTNLSAAAQVRIEVRISKSGSANPGAGDLTGKSAAVKPGAKGVRVVIDQVNP